MHEDLAQLFEQWATSYYQSAQADQGSWLCAKSIYQHELPEDREAYAGELLEAMIWAVSFVVAQRHMDRQVDERSIGWTKRFLELQRYGLDDEDRGARYEVVLVGGLDAPLYADRLDDLDFDDLRGGTEFNLVVVVDHDAALSEPQAQTVAESIHADLNHDADVDTYWQHAENMVLVGIDEPSDASAPQGKQQHAGALVIEH